MSQKIYKHIIPNISDWPISKQSEDRASFVKELDAFMLDRLMARPVEEVTDMIAKTIYRELIRIKEEPWKVDPPNEAQFWKKMRKELVAKSLDKEEDQARANNKIILSKIINRYSEEIVGTFKISTFKFARKFLTAFFNRLLNTAASRNYRRIWSSRYRVIERLNVVGDHEKVRNLFNHGTVVIVPTHFSNLDSIIIGYMFDQIVGLPSFSYGAGLNLWNSGVTAHFLNRIGTYRVDRRKKNPIYLETLKAMSNLSIQRGTNNLFFPGGTRARSGAIEDKLKLGLLGTVVEAQRSLYEQGKSRKVYVVPLVISYHFVLEALYMIVQHLRKTGKERYLKSKEPMGLRMIMKFAWRYFSESNDIMFSFGKPMDVLGNFVDENGKSTDMHGNELDVKDYFITKGEVKKDFQREQEYTRMLADKIVERFHDDNVVLSSQLVAYTAFNILRYQNPKLDIYGVLRLPAEDYVIPIEKLMKAVEQIRERMFEMEKEGKIKLSEQIHWDLENLVKDGVIRMGSFHANSPLKFNKNGDVYSEDFKLLYYYHNRLENYNLAKYVNWSTLEYAIEEF